MSVQQPLYDRMGESYAPTRRADPRIARAISAALGSARTVVNVGAGTGGYEPADREVLAVEPSAVMIRQCPPGAAPVIQASAEDLPLADASVDAALAVITDHHWADRAAGLREMRRVARRRVVVVNSDAGVATEFWLSREYLSSFIDLIPASYRVPGAWLRELEQVLGEVEVHALPVPHDCTDGFYQAYWRRPHAYLDPIIRGNISVFRLLPPADVDQAVERLRRDLETGVWQQRHSELLQATERDVGLRIVTRVLA